MPPTLLVETLLEYQEIVRDLYERLPTGPQQVRLEKRQADLERIVHYLLEKYVALNQEFENLDITTPAPPPTTKMELEERELRQMGNSALLRYGTVLRYICAVEANFQDMPLDESVAKLRLAQAEWRRRCGNSVRAESF